MTKQSVAEFSVDQLPILTHQHRPVITTELLALGYGTQQKNIRMNFSNNADRFEAGKHYYKLEGAELSAFKAQIDANRANDIGSVQGKNGANRPTESGSVPVGKNVRSLILWTERGAARHAKLLNTDKAWDVFEKLEDAYFNQRTEAGFADLGLTFREHFQLDKELRISIEAYGRKKTGGFTGILRTRIIRLCQRLGYEIPEAVRAQQGELEGV